MRRLERSNCAACTAIARYDVGAANRIVTWYAAIACSSASADVFSSSNVAAPARSGKSSRPPSPNVKASGGLPVKMSSGVARSTDRGQQSQLAITSRWKCIVPFGWPVVPDVNAISAVSSSAVATLAKSAGFAAARASRPSAASVSNCTTVVSVGHAARAASSSAASRASHSAWVICALPMMSVSSLARSSGMVATAIPPAFITANQHAAIIGLFGPRSSTRLPGTSRMSSTSTRAMRLARAISSA